MKNIISKLELDKLLEVSYAVSTDDARPSLMGVNIKDNTFAAVSGYVVSTRTCESLEGLSDVTIQTQIIEAYRAIKDDKKTLIEIIATKEQAGFKTDKWTIVGKPIEGNFFNYKSIIPKESNIQVKLESKLLYKALSEFKKSKYVILNPTKFGLCISDETSSFIKRINLFQAGLNTDKFNIAVDPKLLMSALKNYKSTVYMQFTESVKPIVLMDDVNKTRALDMVLPMRIKKDE